MVAVPEGRSGGGYRSEPEHADAEADLAPALEDLSSCEATYDAVVLPFPGEAVTAATPTSADGVSTDAVSPDFVSTDAVSTDATPTHVMPDDALQDDKRATQAHLADSQDSAGHLDRPVDTGTPTQSAAPADSDPPSSVEPQQIRTAPSDAQTPSSPEDPQAIPQSMSPVAGNSSLLKLAETPGSSPDPATPSPLSPMPGHSSLLGPVEVPAGPEETCSPAADPAPGCAASADAAPADAKTAAVFGDGGLPMAPGVDVVGLLAGVDPGSCSGRELLDGIAGWDRIARWVAAQQHRWLSVAAGPGVVIDKDTAAAVAEVRTGVDLDELADTDAEAAAELVAENTIHLLAQQVGPLLQVPTTTAKIRIGEAQDLVVNLPMAHEAMLTGQLSPYRALVIAQGTVGMSEQTRRLAGQVLVNHGSALGIAKLKRLIATTMRSLDREAFNNLGDQAVQERDVQMFTGEHGMGRIWAVLPADQAVLIKGIIDELAEHHYQLQQQDPTISRGGVGWRSKGQLRADCFADILTTLATTGIVDLRDYLTTPPTTPAATTNSSTDTPNNDQKGPAANTGSTAETVPGTDIAADKSPAADIAADKSPAADIGTNTSTSTSTDGKTTSETAPAAAKPAAGELAVSDEAWDADPAAGDGVEDQSLEKPSEGGGRSVGPAPGLRRPLIKPTGLNLTMSLETLLRLRDDPGYLDGFGTIPDHLRDGILISAASITVLLLDNCGTLLDLGKTARFPSKALTRHLQYRDRTCRFPGCANDASHCDLDHQQPFKHPAGEHPTPSPANSAATEGHPDPPSGTKTAGHDSGGVADTNTAGHDEGGVAGTGQTSRCDTGCSDNHAAGETCPSNLAPQCRTHHLIKHHGNWQVKHHPDHTLTWTTPNGHQHTTTPHDWRLTLPAEHIAEAKAQLAARQAQQQAETDRIQAELDAKYPDDPPF